MVLPDEPVDSSTPITCSCDAVDGHGLTDGVARR